MTTDPIPAIEALGYTPREAAFLYLVAAHSGYFLRRQFDYFIDRMKGAIARNFLAKAQAAGHIEVIEYARGWRVYHLLSRSIYRLLKMPESQNRHRKGDASIRSRLLTLDYVLENREDEYYLVAPEEKLDFLAQQRRINPSFYQDSAGQLLPLIKSSLISLENRERPTTSLVRLLFIDEGLLTMTKFARVLEELEPVLCALRNFELIYGANSDRNFEQAGREFWRLFARYNQQSESNYTRDLFGSRFQPQQTRLPISATITTIFFKYAYPPHSRKESRGSKQGSTSDGATSLDLDT
jgi:hypothetical protein